MVSHPPAIISHQHTRGWPSVGAQRPLSPLEAPPASRMLVAPVVGQTQPAQHQAMAHAWLSHPRACLAAAHAHGRSRPPLCCACKPVKGLQRSRQEEEPTQAQGSNSRMRSATSLASASSSALASSVVASSSGSSISTSPAAGRGRRRAWAQRARAATSRMHSKQEGLDPPVPVLFYLPPWARVPLLQMGPGAKQAHMHGTNTLPCGCSRAQQAALPLPLSLTQQHGLLLQHVLDGKALLAPGRYKDAPVLHKS